MGGTALLIKGTADLERFSQRGFLARLLGRNPVRETQIGSGRRLIDLPADNVKGVVPAFSSFIRRTVGTPWSSTQSTLDYLDIAYRVYVRGDREADDPVRWYVQLSFGGCAGMAETSSEVAAHWAAKWWNAEREPIVELLTRGGFSPSHVDDNAENLTFLPLGDFGYAAFRADGYAAFRADAEIFDEMPGTHFEIDQSAVEGNEEQAEALLRALEAEWVDYMSDGRCHCQVCDPRFDHGILANLPIG